MILMFHPSDEIILNAIHHTTFPSYLVTFFQSGVSGSVLVMADIDAKIKAQGDKIRELKAAKSSKDVIDPEVKALLGLKAEFKVQYSPPYIRFTMLLFVGSHRS